MNYSATNMEADQRQRRQEQFQLTLEEQRVLKECSREGIIQRAIPTGILFGIGGYFVGKSGSLHHSKFGAKPAIIGFSIVGYMIGRFSYSKVCLERALAVPNGNLRKIFPQMAAKAGIPIEQPDSYYAPVDITPKTQDPIWGNQHQSTDIDIPAINNFDTVPSDYYVEIKEEADDQTIMKNYTSHDELRKRNRQEYTNRMYGERKPVNERYAEYPQEGGPIIRRSPPLPSQDTQPTIGGGQRTKYGDVWDA